MRINSITTFFNIPTLKNHIVQHKKFQKLEKDTFEMTNPVNFQGMHCSLQDFEIKRIKNLRCPICGQIMLNDEQQRAFIEDVSTKTGKRLKHALEKYEDESIFLEKGEENKHRSIYRPKKQKVVNVIKELAIQNPTLSLAQLVQLHAKDCLGNLILEQMGIIHEINKYIQTARLNDSEKENVTRVLEEYAKRVYGKSSERFKRKDLIQDLLDIKLNAKDKRNICAIATKMPTSITSVDAFFVKYSDKERTSREIAKNFINEATPTTEHLIPKSKNGKNNTENYICDCAHCNGSRGNILFDEWTQDMPDIKENLQEYLVAVEKAFEKGDLSLKYGRYIEDTIRTIDRLSNGKIILTAPEADQGIKRRIFAISAFIEKVGLGISNFEKEIEKLENHPQFKNIQQCLQHKKELSEINEQIAELEKRTAIKTNSEETEISPIKEKFIQKLQELKEEKANLEQKINELNAQIEPEKYNTELLETNTKIQTILSEIAFINKTTKNKNLLEMHNDELLQENIELAKENEALIQKGTVDINDNSLYLKFKENERLYDVSEDRKRELMNLKSEKDSENSDSLTLLNHAQNDIRKQAIELFENDSVRYFANLEKIQSNEEELVILKTRLEEIDEILIKKSKLEKELESLRGDSDLKSIEDTCRRIKKARETRVKIENIEALRLKLKKAKAKQEYNKSILKELQENYPSLSDKEFQELTQQIQGQ